MRVGDLIETLRTYNPDEQVCVLWWDRNMYEFDVPADAWQRVVDEFEGDIESDDPPHGIEISMHLAARAEEEVRGRRAHLSVVE